MIKQTKQLAKSKRMFCTALMSLGYGIQDGWLLDLINHLIAIKSASDTLLIGHEIRETVGWSVVVIAVTGMVLTKLYDDKYQGMRDAQDA